jgi:hypothetical protein
MIALGYGLKSLENPIGAWPLGRMGSTIRRSFTQSMIITFVGLKLFNMRPVVPAQLSSSNLFRICNCRAPPCIAGLVQSDIIEHGAGFDGVTITLNSRLLYTYSQRVVRT